MTHRCHLRALLLAALLATAPAPRAQAPLAPSAATDSATLVYHTTAQFRLGGLPLRMSARTTTSWSLQGGRYETHLHMDTVDFDQVSQGTLGPDDHLLPSSYTEKRPFHSPEAVAIDWPAGRIRYAGGAQAPAPAPGAQDRLSLQFELGRLRLRHPERYATGSSHELRLIGTHDVDPWTFTVGAEEAVDTGRGPLRAVRYSARRRAGEAEETIDIWLGADLRWLPVRIRMVDRNQAVIDSVLQSTDAG
jgi:hypothetical protein